MRHNALKANGVLLQQVLKEITMSRTTLLKGNPISLDGPELKAGDKAPDFTAQASAADGLGAVSLSDFAGKTVVLSVVPSLDTPVCSIQTKKFNERASQLPAD